MTTTIVGNTNSELLVGALTALKLNSRSVSVKAGANTHAAESLGTAAVTLTNPLNRWMLNPNRKDSILGVMGEVIWILSGSEYISGWMSVMVPRAANYSDDGITWRGAYGPRLYRNNQLQAATDRLKADLNTRKSVLSIYDPELDSDTGLINTIGSVNTNDMICNMGLSFKYRDGGLDCTVFNRSQDVFWGMTNVNVVEFTIIQEIIAKMIGVQVGKYHVLTDDLHWYPSVPSVASQADAIMSYEDTQSYPSPKVDIHLGSLDSWSKVRSFFQSFLYNIETCGAIDEYTLNEAIADANVGMDQSSTLASMMWLSGAHFLYSVSGKKQYLSPEASRGDLVTMVADRLTSQGKELPFVLTSS